jgi:hypothetical protein
MAYLAKIAQSWTNLMILKIFSQKKLAFFAETTAIFCKKKIDRNIGF